MTVSMRGSPETCDVECSEPSAVVTCMGGDGCCPEGCASSNDYDCSMGVMVIAGDTDNNILNVVEKLAETGYFGTVSGFNAQNQNVPMPNVLANARAVLVYNNAGIGGTEPLGDALADYFDLGGRRIVVANGANCHDAFRLRGRFEDDGYHVLDEGGVFPNGGTIDEVLLPDSPLMSGVDEELSLESVHCAADLLEGAYAVATYAETGAPVAAVRPIDGKNRVDVNVVPLTIELNDPSIVALLANALRHPL